MVFRLLLLGLLVLVPVMAASADFGIVAASKNVRDGIAEMQNTMERLPVDVRAILAGEVDHVSAEAHALLDRIEGQTAPMLDERVSHELNHLDELIAHLGQELKDLEAKTAMDIDIILKRRITQLSDATAQQIDYMDAELDVWLEKAEQSIIHFERNSEAIIIRELDKTDHFIVRMIALVMFVSGLFVVSLRLVQAAHNGRVWWQVQPDNALPLFLGIVMMGLAFGTTATLALRPDLLLGVYAETSHSATGACLSAELRTRHMERLPETVAEVLSETNSRELKIARQDCSSGSS